MNHCRPKAHRLRTQTLLNQLLKPREGATADKENVGGINLQELLLRVLSSPLRRHTRHGPFDDLQKRLLHPFAGDIPSDRRVLGFTSNLINLVDINDAPLGPLNIAIRRLKQVDDNVLDVLSHITRLSQAGRVRNAKRNIQNARQGLGEQGLTAPRRPQKKNIAFLQLNLFHPDGAVDPLIMIMNRHREDFFRPLLTDNIRIEDVFDLRRLRNLRWHLLLRLLRLDLLGDDVIAETYALVTNINRRTSDQFSNLSLTLPTKGTNQGTAVLFLSSQCYILK